MATRKMTAQEFLDLVRPYEGHDITFRLVPQKMTTCACPVPLVWTGVKFQDANVRKIPKSRGVYALVVQEGAGQLPPHGYVLYIGKAGDGNHTLRKRYSDYCQDRKRPKRPGIFYLLNKWGDVLSFCFAQISDRKVPLTQVEHALNDAMLPPYVDNDFSGDVRQAMNAFPRR